MRVGRRTSFDRRRTQREKDDEESHDPVRTIILPTMSADEFMDAAVAEARAGLNEGGIPIGSVIVHRGRIVGRGHNRRVQKKSATLHGEMDALENAGRLPASTYRECVLYTT